MSRNMQTIQEDIDAIVPYSMHVSSRYLDLTRQKLELTRLPKENETLHSTDEQWALGTPKKVLEPLLDHWLETYDWRAEEDKFNTTLPQFRTLVLLPPLVDASQLERKSIRTHFVHARSTHANAVPLLYIHDWPGSFVEISRIITDLVNPVSSAGLSGAGLAFHVVCPSIPGFGFSDASAEPEFGVAGAAEVFAGLMRRLGYEEYVVCGAGWGFHVAKALAMRERQSVLGVFTWNPVFQRPMLRGQFGAWLKWQVARVTGAKWAGLSFGYVPAEVQGEKGKIRTEAANTRPIGPVMHQLFSLRPQTLAFSLCDSPVGLLAVLLDLVATQGDGMSMNVRPRSPFLHPGELEMQNREYEVAGHERTRSDNTVKASRNGSVDETALAEKRTWTPTDILNWTMMMWLPGAEAGLRWLRRAHIETSALTWTAYCTVPLGISNFRTQATAIPLMWGAASWPIAWVRRHQEAAEMPAWEAPARLASDIRECFGRLLHRQLTAKSPDVMV